MPEVVRACVVGASGYTGAELLRLLLAHPRVEITGVYAKRAAGERLPAIFPQFAGKLDLEIGAFNADAIARSANVAFLALPHAESAAVARALYVRGLHVFDLSADLRLRDPRVYEEWYGHAADPLCREAIYGLPELASRSLLGARLVAVPGCYPTATLLALRPLLDAGLVAREGIIVDAKSGTSGAGRAASLSTHFSEIGEGVRPYKIAGTHRHTVEIEQELGVTGIVFTPHLLPMTRGILSCCYAAPTDPTRPASDYTAALTKRYAGSALVSVVPKLPDTSHVRGTNRAHVHAAYDARAKRVISICAIDNLGKGAAGQAVQCMNLALGFEETLGVSGVAVFP
jgi:N-acetyl-gamma-glutamyl-phosphate reductase